MTNGGAAPLQVEATVQRARTAAISWRETLLPLRLEPLGRFRQTLTQTAASLAQQVATDRQCSEEEVFTSEIIPLADAIRYLECHAPQILKSTSPLGKNPLWLGKVQSTIGRAPLGIVLVVAPSNYPLFLPGTQVIQALAAGNAVLLKPAPAAESSQREFVERLWKAGIPEDVLQLLPSTPQAAHDAIHSGVDLIIATGSTETGQSLMRTAAETCTPSLMELSGLDSVHLLPDAPLEIAAQCLHFALSLNIGRTCIAPRRIYAYGRETQLQFEQILSSLPLQEPSPLLEKAMVPLNSALDQGASLIMGSINGSSACTPLVLKDVPEDSALWQDDHFSSIAVIKQVHDENAALQEEARCPFQLASSIFSASRQRAEDLAHRLPASTVTINDIVVPTADPRIPFGGSGNSGFGVTRGQDGLLALTRPKTTMYRSPSATRLHLNRPSPSASFFGHLLTFFHAPNTLRRLRSLAAILKEPKGPDRER
ncbi:MAG: aldehyde dehydrogenase family protein [Verrucomicrobiota bacterium]